MMERTLWKVESVMKRCFSKSHRQVTSCSRKSLDSRRMSFPSTWMELLQDPKIRAFVSRPNASETNEFPKSVFLSLLSQDAARTQTVHTVESCAAVTGRLQ